MAGYEIVYLTLEFYMKKESRKRELSRRVESGAR